MKLALLQLPNIPNHTNKIWLQNRKALVAPFLNFSKFKTLTKNGRNVFSPRSLLAPVPTSALLKFQNDCG